MQLACPVRRCWKRVLWIFACSMPKERSPPTSKTLWKTLAWVPSLLPINSRLTNNNHHIIIHLRLITPFLSFPFSFPSSNLCVWHVSTDSVWHTPFSLISSRELKTWGLFLVVLWRQPKKEMFSRLWMPCNNFNSRAQTLLPLWAALFLSKKSLRFASDSYMNSSLLLLC